MTGPFLGRIYPGTVVDNTTNEHRFVRVRLAGIDDGLPDDQLPWSGVARPLFRGGGSAVGIWSRPRVGSRVLGMFDGGNRDSYVVMFELENPASTLDWGEDEWGVQDEEGTYVRVKVGETLEVQHRGATVTVDGDGKVVVHGTELEFQGPARFTDPVTMDRTLSVAEDVDLGASLTVETEATIADIDFTTHVHGGVQTGGGKTQVPE